MPKKHTISLLVDNEPGVLSRVAGLFSGRGFNIESLCVAETMDPLVSRITLVTRGDDAIAPRGRRARADMYSVSGCLSHVKGYELACRDRSRTCCGRACEPSSSAIRSSCVKIYGSTASRLWVFEIHGGVLCRCE